MRKRWWMACTLLLAFVPATEAGDPQALVLADTFEIPAAAGAVVVTRQTWIGEDRTEYLLRGPGIELVSSVVPTQTGVSVVVTDTSDSSMLTNIVRCTSGVPSQSARSKIRPEPMMTTVACSC